jgi:biopolymer transport protein ExbB/TolQ
MADQMAPCAILIIFGWIQIELLFHFIRLFREWSAVKLFQAAANGSGNLSNVPEGSRAGRRARLFTQQSQAKTLHETVPGAAAIDASGLDNAYSFIRVYVWILPVVGFIGTALGMSHAIAGFGDSLKGNLDVGTMTARLSQLVIPGLANAFSTTILALAAAIIGHFCSSAIQTAENLVLDDLDQATVRLLARVPTADNSTNLIALAAAVQQAVQRISQLDLGPAAKELSRAAAAMQGAASEMQRTATAPYHVTVKRGDQA